MDKSAIAANKYDYTPIKAKGRGPGGWYCDGCGYTTKSLPSGAVSCPKCGRLGLLGFSGRLAKGICLWYAECRQLIWVDGVNSYPARLRRIHAEEHLKRDGGVDGSSGPVSPADAS